MAGRGPASVHKYRVQGKAEIFRRITDAIERCGATVLRTSRFSEAPLEVDLRTAVGEELSLVCYAFFANKYEQGDRPADEHRFQIKYGSDFQSYHEIFIDPRRERITLLLGVHVDEEVFVAVDPALYNPTWFSRSVEFKTANVRRTQQTGWACWERSRSLARRKVPMPVPTSETECVLGFTAEHFIRYVQFERDATGLDVGERMLFAERMGEETLEQSAAHPLERLYQLSSAEILDIIWGAKRLGVAVRGSVAEYHLGKHFSRLSGIEHVQPIDEDGRPDFEIVYRSKPYLVECKNVLRSPTKLGPKVDFQKTRASLGDRCTRYYERDAFHVLAACLHPITERWEFSFCRTSTMQEHPACPGRLSQKVIVAGETWHEDIRQVLGA